MRWEFIFTMKNACVGPWLAFGLIALASATAQPLIKVNTPGAITVAQDYEGPIVDDRLVEQYVRSNLRSDPIVDDSDIRITVKEGVVTLEGSVACTEEVERAEEVARQTRGAREVANHLRSDNRQCIRRYGEFIRTYPR